MGELIDKLERARRGAAQPLGFGGAVRRERTAPLLLLGAVEAGDAAQAKAVLGAELDGALVIGTKPARKADVHKSTKALSGTTFGVWTGEAPAEDASGADFHVFSSDATPLDALGGEERTTVMQVAPELDDGQLRTIDLLPFDAFLVSLADAKRLTVGQLMRLGRVRGVTARWLLILLPAPPSRQEAEHLRDIGAAALIVPAAGQTAEGLRAVHAMLREIPHAPPKRRERALATVPSLPGAASPPARPEPDDDDDWDDD